jgi:hypothetical protein
MDAAASPSQPPTAAPAAPAADAPAPPKLLIEKFADRDIVCFKFSGVIDEGFEGKKLARAVEHDTVVLDLGNVKKISSFGIREWIDFVADAAKQSKTLILIECAPKVVDQLNMVANFTAGGRVFSFYAPFRCDYCDSEHRVLLQVDRDHELIKSMKLAERPCPSCKEASYFDEDGATFFSFMAGQERFELDPAIAAFLAAKLDYKIADASRKLHVDKIVEGRLTYLRLAGDLDTTFPRDKLAEGLEGIVVADVHGIGRIEPAGAAQWRSFVQQIAPLVETLYLVGVPASFLERLCGKDDLGAKARVASLELAFTCASCGTTTARELDVDAHHDVLKFATAPELRCAECKSALACAATETQMTILPGLPKPELAKELVKKIEFLRARRLDKKPSTSITAIAKPGDEARPRSVVAPLVIALAIAAIAIAGVYAYKRTRDQDPGPFGLGAIVKRSAAERPAWLAWEWHPGDARCAAERGATTCVAASFPSASQEEAEDEASDAALEALAAQVGKQPNGDARAAVVAAFARDPLSSQARRDFHDGRRAVARVIARYAPSVAARYWELYEAPDGRRFVASARFVVPAGSLAELAARFAKPQTALGATFVDFHPELGWRFPKLDHGAVVTKLDRGAIQDMGIAEGYIVLAVNGREIADAAELAKLATDEYARLADSGGTLRLLVQTPTGDPREFQSTMPGKQVEPATTPTRPKGGPRDRGGPSGVNVWDRYSGQRQGGRDDPTQ